MFSKDTSYGYLVRCISGHLDAGNMLKRSFINLRETESEREQPPWWALSPYPFLITPSLTSKAIAPIQGRPLPHKPVTPGNGLIDSPREI